MVESSEWLHEVAESAGSHDDAVQQLLHAVRTQLGMELAWTSEFVGSQQVFRYVDAAPGVLAPVMGQALPLSGSFCARVLDGRLPAVIPDSRQELTTALLDVTHELQIGCYLGAPLLAADGTVEGMLCLTSRSAAPAMGERDLQTLRLLAQLLHDLQVRALDATAVLERRQAIVDELTRVISGEGRWAVVQPVIDATTGAVVVVEGLSRFATERTPAQWFDVAARVGLSSELELAAAASVLDLLREDRVPPGAAVSVNLSPATVVGGGLDALFDALDPARLVLEVTEHQVVEDYDALAAVLAPWRSRGLRLAVDDAGAGYASLQHVVRCQPDLVKLDMALVRGIDTDAVRQALVRAVTGFAGVVGIVVVAEGVETQSERDTLVDLGVALLQGFLIGRPAEVP